MISYSLNDKSIFKSEYRSDNDVSNDFVMAVFSAVALTDQLK